MLLADIQNGRLKLIELTTGHSDQSGNQRRVTKYYTHCQQCRETLKIGEYLQHKFTLKEAIKEF